MAGSGDRAGEGFGNKVRTASSIATQRSCVCETNNDYPCRHGFSRLDDQTLSICTTEAHSHPESQKADVIAMSSRRLQ
jgi:hypothetical protein